MVTYTVTHLWISQPNWYLFYKFKKLLSQKQNLSVGKSSQTDIFTTGFVCSNILCREQGVSFLLSLSRNHVLAHPWTAMLLSWIRDDVTIVAIMTWVATQPRLDDFPFWIRLDLDSYRVSSETGSGSKPNLESSLEARLSVNMTPGVNSD